MFFYSAFFFCSADLLLLEIIQKNVMSDMKQQPTGRPTASPMTNPTFVEVSTDEVEDELPLLVPSEKNISDTPSLKEEPLTAFDVNLIVTDCWPISNV